MQTAKQSCELLLKVRPQVHAHLALRLTFHRSSTLFSTTANWKHQVGKLGAQEDLILTYSSCKIGTQRFYGRSKSLTEPKFNSFNLFFLEYYCCRWHCPALDFNWKIFRTAWSYSCQWQRKNWTYHSISSLMFRLVWTQLYTPSNECWLVIGVYADYARIRQGVWHAVKLVPWLMTAFSVDESYR